MPNIHAPKSSRLAKKRVKRVALLLQSDMAFDRAIAQGIGDYIHSHSGWVVLMDPMTEASMQALKLWAPDGIITSLHLPKIKEITTITDIPMVGFGGYSPQEDGEFGFPIVTSNQEEIGRMAASYFINKGLRNFAFCGGTEKAQWLQERKKGFEDELRKQAYTCSIYEPSDADNNMPSAMISLGAWLDSLPKPTGVFVYFDGWARWVLDACVLRGLQVPQEISVLGVDNDQWLCELSQPRLSSIDPNIETAGYVAAETLNNLMTDTYTGSPITYINPSKVEERDSSNYLAFEDPELAFAVRYIKEHACDPIDPADVLKVTGMSNSTAYRKFMKSIGRSIHSEIQRVQLDRVKELLTTTNLNVTQIGNRSGFDNIRYFTKIFRDDSGMTPTEYRRSKSTPKVDMSD